MLELSINRKQFPSIISMYNCETTQQQLYNSIGIITFTKRQAQDMDIENNYYCCLMNYLRRLKNAFYFFAMTSLTMHHNISTIWRTHIYLMYILLCLYQKTPDRYVMIIRKGSMTLFERILHDKTKCWLSITW